MSPFFHQVLSHLNFNQRGLFLLANWTILAPVGGITIYETFELSLHPLRLQIDAKVGRRIMEYVWPDREKGQTSTEDSLEKEKIPAPPLEIRVKSPTSPAARSSIDSPRGLHTPKRSMDPNGQTTLPTLRRLGSSRSFTDLRSAKDNGPLNPSTFLSPQGFLTPPAFLKRTQSSDSINFSSVLEAASVSGTSHTIDQEEINAPDRKLLDDAHIMKTRSSQKSFVMVRISRSVLHIPMLVFDVQYCSSLHLLLSVVKEGSFECHDARIKTRELDYRNQTWSVRLISLHHLFF